MTDSISPVVDLQYLFAAPIEAVIEADFMAARQFVRKVSGFQRPSPANTEAFEAAIREIAATSSHLLASLQLGARAR